MAIIEQPGVEVHSPIELEEAQAVIRTGTWQEDTALKLVIQDAIRAENYEAQKQWVMQWPTATTLYQSPFSARYWEGTQTEKANVPFYTVATAVNSLVPQIISGLFYENPPFIIQERPRTSAQAARAVGSLIAYQLEEINFREELRLGIVNAVLFGTAMWKWGWETYTRKRKTYKHSRPVASIFSPSLGQVSITDDDSIEEVVEEEDIDRPTFEHIVNLRHVLVDPGLAVPDIRKAKYVVHRLYLTWNDLDKLRGRPGFNIPPRDELLALFFPPKEEALGALSEVTLKNPLWDARAEPRFEETTADPLNQPLEVLERWDNDTYICVLQQKLVIANDENIYGVIPFLSVGWWDVPEAFWGMGLAKTIGSEQRLQQGITNIWLDNAALNLNGVYVRVKGKSIPTQSIRIAPGKIVEVDNKDDFKVLERLPAVPEAGQHLQMSQQRAEQISGSAEVSMQGVAGSGGHSNIARTATGVNALAGGSGSRVADFVEKLSNQVMVPFLYHVHELNCALLPPQTMRSILSDELQHEFLKENQNDILSILNARVKFSILAGSKMQARKNMAQALPILIQFVTNQQTVQQVGIQNKTVDVVEVMRMLFEVSDWKNFNDVVRDMSPEEAERARMNSPAGIAQMKAQAQQGQQQQQAQLKAGLIDQENISRAGREILRQAMEKSAYQDEITGEPGGIGFGGES